MKCNKPWGTILFLKASELVIRIAVGKTQLLFTKEQVENYTTGKETFIASVLGTNTAGTNCTRMNLFGYNLQFYKEH